MYILNEYFYSATCEAQDYINKKESQVKKKQTDFNWIEGKMASPQPHACATVICDDGVPAGPLCIKQSRIDLVH